MFTTTYQNKQSRGECSDCITVWLWIIAWYIRLEKSTCSDKQEKQIKEKQKKKLIFNKKFIRHIIKVKLVANIFSRRLKKLRVALFFFPVVNAPRALWSLNTVKAVLGQELFTGTLRKRLWCLVLWYQNPQGIYYKWHHDCNVKGQMTNDGQDEAELRHNDAEFQTQHRSDPVRCLTMEACSLTYLVRWRLLALGGSGNHATQLSLSFYFSLFFLAVSLSVSHPMGPSLPTRHRCLKRSPFMQSNVRAGIYMCIKIQPCLKNSVS